MEFIPTKPSDSSDWRHCSLEEMEARVARFEDAVRAAQLAAPPNHDLLKNAVTRKGAGRCPIWLRRVTPDLIIRHGEALVDLFTEFPDDLGRVSPYDLTVGYNIATGITPVQAMMGDAEWVNEWGVGWKHIVGGVGPSECSHPLEDWARLDEYIATLPDADEPGRLDAAAPPTRELHQAGKYVFGLFGGTYWYPFSMRGFENGLMDLYSEPENMHRLLDAIHDYSMKLVRQWAKVGVDSLLVLDDWGTQTGLLISPQTFREFFKPYYKELFAEIHRCGMDCFLHTCGNVIDIVDDLIEIGLDVLDPVQVGTMDIKELASRFGGRITFQGTIDVQQLLPYSNPREIKDTIRRSIDILGKPFGNSLILAPTNTITPDVPIENLRAMFEACHEQ